MKYIDNTVILFIISDNKIRIKQLFIIKLLLL